MNPLEHRRIMMQHDRTLEFRPPLRRVGLSMPGLCCGDCIEHLNRLLEAMEGVGGCQIDARTRSAVIEYDESRCALADVVTEVHRAGYQVETVLHMTVDDAAE